VTYPHWLRRTEDDGYSSPAWQSDYVIQSRGPRGRGSRAFNEGLNYKTRRDISRAIDSNAIGLHPWL
jgi:hypothetical protein